MESSRRLAETFLNSEPEKRSNSYTLKKMLDYEELIRKNFFRWDEHTFEDFFFEYAGIVSIDTLNTYLCVFRGFADWAVYNRIEIDGVEVKYSIFRYSAGLDINSLAAQMSGKMELYYYDDDDIDRICAGVRINRDYIELVIRLFYEGISSTAEFTGLRADMFDLRSQQIALRDGRVIPMSEKLAACAEKMLSHEITEIEYPTGRREVLSLCEKGGFLKYYLYKEATDRNKWNFISKMLRAAEQELEIVLSPKKLYQSGLLRFIYKKFGNEEQKVIEILNENNKTKASSNYLLDKALMEGGYKTKSYRVKSLFKPYVMKLLAARQ